MRSHVACRFLGEAEALARCHVANSSDGGWCAELRVRSLCAEDYRGTQDWSQSVELGARILWRRAGPTREPQPLRKKFRFVWVSRRGVLPLLRTCRDHSDRCGNQARIWIAC